MCTGTRPLAIRESLTTLLGTCRTCKECVPVAVSQHPHGLLAVVLTVKVLLTVS